MMYSYDSGRAFQGMMADSRFPVSARTMYPFGILAIAVGVFLVHSAVA